MSNERIPEDALAHLEENQELRVVSTPDLPEWAVLTVGEIDDLEQWFDDVSGPGSVYLLWYVPTDEQREDYAKGLRKKYAKFGGFDRAHGPAVVCLDSLDEYPTVYRTKKDARLDLEFFVKQGRPEKLRIP